MLLADSTVTSDARFNILKCLNSAYPLIGSLSIMVRVQHNIAGQDRSLLLMSISNLLIVSICERSLSYRLS